MTDRPSLSRQIAEIRRELVERERVYPRLVASGKLRRSVADYQTESLAAALDTLEWCQRNAEVIRRVASLTKAEQAANPEVV